MDIRKHRLKLGTLGTDADRGYVKGGVVIVVIFLIAWLWGGG